jgi:putative hemolysin
LILSESYSVFLPLSLSADAWVTSAGLIGGLLSVVALLLLSAAASATETAYFSLSPSQLNTIRSSKAVADKRITRLLDDSRRLLATILIINNLVNVGIVILSTFLVGHYMDFSNNPALGFFFQVVVITALLLLLGEIMPKVVATRNPVMITRLMAAPLTLLQRAFYPFSSLLVNSTRFLDRRQAGGADHRITLDDISNAIDITADGKVDEEDRRIMKSITRFGDISAREIMSPRVDLTAVSDELNFGAVQKIIVESGYSRIPVYSETPDSITGILYIKDLLPFLTEKDDFEWQKLVRPPFFVPENKPINDLMQEFREKKNHMAVVVDEYGGTSGIITLEDILEEIVGEINDEFDTDAEQVLYTRLSDTTWVFEGKTTLNDMCRVLGIDDRIFDEAKGESESLAGLVLELAGKIPAAGESFTLGGFRFQVDAADKRRIKKVRITLPEYGEES